MSVLWCFCCGSACCCPLNAVTLKFVTVNGGIWLRNFSRWISFYHFVWAFFSAFLFFWFRKLSVWHSMQTIPLNFRFSFSLFISCIFLDLTLFSIGRFKSTARKIAKEKNCIHSKSLLKTGTERTNPQTHRLTLTHTRQTQCVFWFFIFGIECHLDLHFAFNFSFNFIFTYVSMFTHVFYIHFHCLDFCYIHRYYSFFFHDCYYCYIYYEMRWMNKV